MKRATILAASCLLPLLAAAQTAARVGGPVSGVVFDRNARALRPMVGVPGASYLGDALVAEVDAAAVSPDGSMALVSTAGKTLLISGLLSGAPAATPLDASGDRFAWSPDGAWAVVSSAGEARVLRDLRTSRASGAPIVLPGEVKALAIGDSGDLAAACEGGLYLLAAGSAPRLAAALPAPTALAFRKGDLFAASAGAILLVENFASSPAVSTFVEDAGAIVGLQLSADARRLFAADAANRLLKAFDLSTRAAAGQVDLDCTPSELGSLGGRNIWTLNSDAGGATLYVGTGSDDPASWFVPAGRVE